MQNLVNQKGKPALPFYTTLFSAILSMLFRFNVPGTKSSLKKVMYRPPIEKTPGNQELYRKLVTAAHKLGIPIHEKYCGGGSDGNYTSAQGIPTIDSLGPIGSLEHTDDEYMLVETLFSRCKLTALFILELTA